MENEYLCNSLSYCNWYKKDKNSKAKEKATIDKLETIYNKNLKDLKDRLIEKLMVLLKKAFLL